MKIVLASSNKHKVKEINEIIRNLTNNQEIEFVLPPEGFDPVEDGETFEENSYIKARAAWEVSKNWSLADDSGLCIDALGGKPGIYSARYEETPQKRIDRVLRELQGIKDRSARFKCCMTLINPQGEKVFSCTGVCEGSIAEKQSGTHGFGYDPIFSIKGSDKTMADLSDEEKNRISHRARALGQVAEYLRSATVYDNIK